VGVKTTEFPEQVEECNLHKMAIHILKAINQTQQINQGSLVTKLDKEEAEVSLLIIRSK